MAALSLPRFSRAELLFSGKSFAAAMLAMYLASRAGLPRPFWALMTTYIVAHPLAGAVRSKAAYRFFGTLIGSTATVLLVPALSNAPELLTLVLALWVGLCLCISLLDRTPRSYVFMLAGYTAALIGFPSVQTPLALFDTAVARVEEIGLGIFCATLVHSLVLPAGLAPTVLGLLDRTLQDAQVARRPAAARRPQQQRRSETPRRRPPPPRRRHPHSCACSRPMCPSTPRTCAGPPAPSAPCRTALPRSLRPCRPSKTACRRWSRPKAGSHPTVAAVLSRAAQWLREEAEPTGDAATRAERLQALRRAIDVLSATPASAEQQTPWGRALRIGLAGRLAELVDGWTACAQLRLDIDERPEGRRAAAPHGSARQPRCCTATTAWRCCPRLRPSSPSACAARSGSSPAGPWARPRP